MTENLSEPELSPKTKLSNSSLLVRLSIVAVHPDGVQAACDILAKTVTGCGLYAKFLRVGLGVESQSLKSCFLHALPGGNIHGQIEIAGEFDLSADKGKADALW